ncbi:hypothetical protein PMIN03_002031 [Paraphaeosphaeria minitans]
MPRSADTPVGSASRFSKLHVAFSVKSWHPLDRAQILLCDDPDAVNGLLCVSVTYLKLLTTEPAQSFSIGSTATEFPSQPTKQIRIPRLKASSTPIRNTIPSLQRRTPIGAALFSCVRKKRQVAQVRI